MLKQQEIVQYYSNFKIATIGNRLAQIANFFAVSANITLAVTCSLD